MPPSRISIVMPVWNGEAFLREAVESILAQTFADFELLVVDDGSTDATPAILASYADPRLRVFHLDHAGIVLALNHGVSQARAPWIARQDADDISLPGRLARQWRSLERRPDAVLCHTDVELIGEGALTFRLGRFSESSALLAARLCFHCPIVHTTVMFRKANFEAVGGYLPEDRHAEDFSLWGRLLERGPFVGISEKLVQFRVHTMSVSKRNLATQLALTERIATEHCRRFLRLDLANASRAFALLRQAPAERAWREWLWFAAVCIPRLRWQSLELYAWLLSQTLKTLAGKRAQSPGAR